MQERLTNLLTATGTIVDLVDAITALHNTIMEIDATNALNLRHLLTAEYLLLIQTKKDIHSLCNEIDLLLMGQTETH